MNKYIRTKDGIFENKPLEKSLGIRKGRGYEIVYKEQDIIAEADTIEELCDEYMLYDSKHYKNNYIGSLEDVLEWKDILDKRKIDKPQYNVYGAIWTDKGLQFVALMNSEGVLELI